MIDIGAIDCDIHAELPGVSTLLPYLDAYWHDSMVMVRRGFDKLDLNSYPPNAPLSARPDWRPAEGKAGTRLDLMQAHALDHFGLRYAILNCVSGAQVVYNADLGAALCGAVNEWIAQEWLDRDPRLRASVVVSLLNPRHAVAEIEKRATDRRFVQVLALAMGEMPMGREIYWPVYEAAAHHGLPIGIHAGSMYRFAPTQGGFPSYLVEDYSAQSLACATQMFSFVASGVFVRFPALRLVLLESGVSWLPAAMWRFAKDWRGVRTEVPWVDANPAEIIREHVRLTLQPFDAPPDADDVARVVAQLGDERMLLFSTDYPHWQFDGDAAVPPGLPETLVRRIMVDNPLETYPRLRETVQ